MAEIVSVEKHSQLSKSLRNMDKVIVLAGGCFDVLHPGHVIFLEKAKRAGDILIVLLESDEKVRKLKGDNRPVQTQEERAKVLSALRSVDYVVMLPFIDQDSEYDNLIGKIRPDIIAATRGDTKVDHHLRLAKITGAKLSYVTEMIRDYSTSKILNR